jgi:HPt (histidine-containing phosphotransfer) domain-containing protein
MPFKMNIPGEMLRKYHERRKRDLEELTKAVAAKDFEPFCRIGHQLKGNGATYGYEELGRLGQKMEEAGNEKNFAAAESCLAELISWVASHQ